jgi:hypothetical protein
MLEKCGCPNLNVFLPQMSNWHPRQLKKIEILAALWSYQLNSIANLAHLPQDWAKWAQLAVLFRW